MSGKSEKANRKLHLVKDKWPVDTETPLIVAPDGTAAVSTSETEELPPVSFLFCKLKMKEWFPLDTPGTIDQKARQMYERHPFLAKAYADGLRMGRDLRERSQRGLGWEPWPSLAALTPRERGYIMLKIREEIGVAQ